jgi:hypothetical protein
MSRKNLTLNQMIKMYVRHTVADYAKWRAVFDEHNATRKKFGAAKTDVFTNAQNPKEILTVIEWGNKEQANNFLEKSDIKEIMKEAGVLTAPEISFSE